MFRLGLPVAMVAFLTWGCGGEVGGSLLADGPFVNTLTGQACQPNALTFMPKDHSNGNTSPTGIPGDNMDDERSGKIDCLYDGNSGQGDDWKYPECTFPQPGCDDEGCCEVPDEGGNDDGIDDDPPFDDDPVDPPPPEEEV